MTSSARQVSGANQTGRALLELRELILEGRLAPGQRVSEIWAVEHTGVSRTPVRAALARLGAEGFLESIPSGGYMVRQFTDAEVFDAIEVRGLMEGLGARRAAEVGVDAAMLDELHRIVTDIDDVIEVPRLDADSLARYAELNQEFHDGLKVLSGSSVIADQIDRANAFPFASASGLVIAQSSLPDSHAILRIAQYQHRSVMEAIRARHGARAEMVMREHALLAARNLRSAIADRSTLELVPGASMIAAAD